MPLCRILPFCRLTLDTSLTPEQVATLLGKHVANRRWRSPRLHPDQLPYRGTVSPRKFKILRNLGYRDGWQPVVRGKMKPTASGTRIRVTMRLMIPGYFAAFVLWLATVIFAIAIIAAAIGKGQLAGLVVLSVYVVGLALVVRSFWLEADRARQFLIELFPAPASKRIADDSTMTRTPW